MKSILKSIDDLNTQTRQAMAGLLADHFDGVTCSLFEWDLADKTHAVLLYQATGELIGFSTFALYTDTGPDGYPATIVCSGDTIVAPHAWGTRHLPSSWIRAVHQLHQKTSNSSIYWLLITSGYRTYRFLPVFVKRYHPSPIQEADAKAIACMHRLATERWGEQYDPQVGVVRLDHPQPLRQHLSTVPEERSDDVHIAHFLRCNPGHSEGDELVSFASLAESNLTRAGLRMLHPAKQTDSVGHVP
ncbi:MAG: hypothetical protein AAGB26_17215 [Planctomycetota bacterium]